MTSVIFQDISFYSHTQNKYRHPKQVFVFTVIENRILTTFRNQNFATVW